MEPPRPPPTRAMRSFRFMSLVISQSDGCIADHRPPAHVLFADQAAEAFGGRGAEFEVHRRKTFPSPEVAKMAAAARLSRATTSGDVRDGAARPNHNSYSAAGNPTSAMVGTSGNSRSRFGR